MNEFFPFIPVAIIIGVLLALLVSYRKYQRFKKNKQLEENGNELPEMLILKRPFAQYPGKSLRKFQLILVLSFLLVSVSFFSVLLLNVDSFDAHVDRLLKVISDDLKIQFVFIMMLVFTILYPMYLGRSAKNEQVVLTKESISYHPAGIFITNLFFPAWTMKWENATAISMERAGMQSRLCLTDITGKKRCLIVNQWREMKTNDNSRPILFSEIWEANELYMNPAAILDRPLVRYIKKYTDINLEISKSDMNFDLLSSPKIKTILIFMLAMGSYSLIDALLNMETYLVTPSLWWFVIGGVAGSVFAFLKMSDNKIPLSNTIGVSVIFGVFAGIALYPGLLRINQLTDSYGLRSYEYQMKSDGVFRSNDPSLPEIRMAPDKYWKSIKIGDKYSFRIRKGGLGFYQIDMDKVYANMRNWYCQQEKENPMNIRVGCE
ncbi:MAG: hypothetical protein P8Y24_00085 [Gammaproteobacteria bacterium]